MIYFIQYVQLWWQRRRQWRGGAAAAESRQKREQWQRQKYLFPADENPLKKKKKKTTTSNTLLSIILCYNMAPASHWVSATAVNEDCDLAGRRGQNPREEEQNICLNYGERTALKNKKELLRGVGADGN